MLVAKITAAVNAREEWSRSQCMAPKVNLSFREYLHLLESFGKGLPVLTTLPDPDTDTKPPLPMHDVGPNETQMFMSVKANKELHRFDQLLDLDFDAQDALVEVPYDEGDQALLELEQALAGPPRRH